MSAPVRCEIANGVATVTMDRPEAMNALDVAMKVGLRDTLRAPRRPSRATSTSSASSGGETR